MGREKNAEVGSKQNKFVCGPQRRARGLTDVSIFVESWTAVEAAVGQPSNNSRPGGVRMYDGI